MAWIDVLCRTTLAQERMIEVEAGGAALLLFDLGGAVYATAAVCPHHAAWLSQGRVDGEAVECPRHMGRFHIPTGLKLGGPVCPDLRVYPTRIEGERVLVDVVP